MSPEHRLDVAPGIDPAVDPRGERESGPGAVSEHLHEVSPEDTWSPAGLTEALQQVADSVSDLAGFEVAAISVLRPSERFEYVAISSTDPSARNMLGKGNTLEVIREQNATGIKWGRFDYMPHDRFEEWQGLATWRPDVDYPGGADAWHPDDMLASLLYSPEGQVIGMLSLDIPLNGRKPNRDQLQLMEAFAIHAERVLSRGLDRVRITERLKLANAARTIVRCASNFVSLEQVLEDCRPVLVEVFNLTGIWIQMFAEDRAAVSLVTTAAGDPVPVPTRILLIAERAAREAWGQQSVSVVSPQADSCFISAEEKAEIIDYLTGIGAGSILFVPLGSGNSCMGSLVLPRYDPNAAWTDTECETAGEIGRDLGQALFNGMLFERNQDLLEQLQDLDDYKRTLVDMMVHELKNPLTAIAGHLEIAQSVDEVPPMVVGSLAAIDRGTERLMQLVNNLLTLSRISDYAEEMESVRVDLTDLISQNVELLQIRAQADETELSWTETGPMHVRGHQEMLSLVCSNLISNAVKYTPPGGTIQVKLRREDPEAVLTVSDTGLGISAADQSRVFDAFFRSTNPVARELPGTGLGLTIVARVIKEHDGTISMSSELGGGTVVTVRLPLDEVGQQ